MPGKKKSPQASSNTGLTKKTNLHDTSSTSQRQRLFEWLSNKPITTIQARHELNILAPAPRVHELRHDFGYNIITHWVTALTPDGNRHWVANYILFPGKFQGGKK